MSQAADISITVGGDALGELRGANVSIQMDMIGVAAEEVYGWEKQLPAARSWSASGDLLIPARGSDDALQTLKQAYAERSTLAVVIAFNELETETGTAMVSSFSMSASIGGVLEGTIQLIGTGSLV